MKPRNTASGGHALDELQRSVYELGRTMRQKMLSCDTGDLNMGQLHALLYMQEKGAITMKELAVFLKITSPSATSFADRLVKMKYAVRESDPNNRRVVRLKITEKGIGVVQVAMTSRRKVFQKVMGVLSASDQKQLTAIIRKIIVHCPL